MVGVGRLETIADEAVTLLVAIHRRMGCVHFLFRQFAVFVAIQLFETLVVHGGEFFFGEFAVLVAVHRFELAVAGLAFTHGRAGPCRGCRDGGTGKDNELDDELVHGGSPWG